jgi:uncharacterized protein
MNPHPAIDCLYSIDSAAPAISGCGRSLEATVTAMNQNGVEQVVLGPCTRFKCDRHWFCSEIQIDEVLHFVATRPTRFAGLVSYNPFAIIESLQQVTEAITERDFRAVYVHTDGNDVGLHDPRMYPLYARCVELNVPLMLQVGTRNRLPATACPAPASDIDPILVDFPDLRIIAAWSGRLQCDEVAVLFQKHSSIHLATDANVSPEEESALLNFLSAYPDRCMWGSNGLPWPTLLQRVRSLQLPDTQLKLFLHDNAFQIFGLARPLASAAIPFPERITVAER